MSKADLKSAMEALQVKKPLRLPAAVPTFRVPSASNIPGNESIPGIESNPGSLSVSGSNPPEVQKSREPEIPEIPEHMAGDIPGQKQSLGSISTHGLNETQGSKQIARRSQPRRVTAQDEAVISARSVESGLARGYTRIPNSLLMRLVGGECSKHETQVLLLAARMTISFRRDLAPMSKSVIEKFTGIRGSAALHALASLENAGLIRRIPGDERRPSRVGLVLDPGWDNPQGGGNPGPISTPGSNTSRDEIVSGDHFQPASPGKFVPTRKDRDSNKRNSLSKVPEKLRSYFDEIKAPRKRESELTALEELRADFSDLDIADCLELVRQRGIRGPDGEATRCHSPMAYLAKAMSELLSDVNARREFARQRADRDQQASEAAKRKVEQEAREAKEWVKKERAFKKAFPTEERQHEAISELCAGMPFSRDGHAARTFAIGRWWENLTAYERGEYAYQDHLV